jgi:hypothetical protein
VRVSVLRIWGLLWSKLLLCVDDDDVNDNDDDGVDDEVDVEGAMAWRNGAYFPS